MVKKNMTEGKKGAEKNQRKNIRTQHSPYVIRKNIKKANKAQVSIFAIAFGIQDEANYDFLKALSLENYGKA